MGSEAAAAPLDPGVTLVALDADLPAAVLRLDDGELRVFYPDEAIPDTEWTVLLINQHRLVLEHRDGDQWWVDGPGGKITRLTQVAPAQPPVQDWVIRKAEFVDGAPAAPPASAPSDPTSEAPQP